MKIGIATTWFERGAAYVSKIFMDMLVQEGHEVFIYAHGGENIASQKAEKWNQPYVTRDHTYSGMKIDKRKFFRWIQKNQLDCVFFNEQQHFQIVAETKKAFSHVKLGSYIDYYTENTLSWFSMFDFVICNTHRHMQAMKDHPQKFYIRWGTDVELFSPKEKPDTQLVFFHSAGMSERKGTDVLVDAFIDGECYKEAKLVIHTQRPIEGLCKYKKEELASYNVEVIEKTVTAPGLYYLGDVYVYPTRLDGLGLTMYEALSCGLPVITTNFPPMNEAVTDEVGKLVEVEDFYCRGDAYYYPMAVCSKDSLIECMRWYIDHPQQLQKQKEAARTYALKHYDIGKRSREFSDAFEQAQIRSMDINVYKNIIRHYGWRNSTLICKLRESNTFRRLLRGIFG